MHLCNLHQALHVLCTGTCTVINLVTSVLNLDFKCLALSHAVLAYDEYCMVSDHLHDVSAVDDVPSRVLVSWRMV